MSGRVSVALFCAASTLLSLSCPALAIAQVKVRSCAELETDFGRIAADSKLRPSLAPRDTELEAARAAVDAAKTDLDLQETNRALQEAALNAAVSKPADDASGESIKAARASLVAAATARDQASATLKTAKATLNCQESAHAAVRSFRHSVGLGLLAARAADDTARFALALRYQYTAGASQAWEASLEAGRFWLSVDDPERDTLLNAMYRWKFGINSSALVLGTGLGWLPTQFGHPWRSREYALLGDVGVEFHVKNACSSLSGRCWTVWPDLRASVQPWLPFDGSSVAILFGIQVGASVGFERVSP